MEEVMKYALHGYKMEEHLVLCSETVNYSKSTREQMAQIFFENTELI